MEFIKLFCSAMPSSIKNKGEKKFYKPSIKDSENWFILCAETLHEATLKINELLKTCRNEKITLQPMIICIGKKLDAVEFYVLLDDFKYHCDSFLESLDLNFKIFHVFNLEYPKENYNLWLFIQKYLFNIDTNFDNNVPIINSIISDFHNRK